MKKTIFLFALFTGLIASAQPFQCNGDFFLTLTNNGPSVFYRVKIDPVNNQVLFNPLPADNAGLSINAIGYRATDNYIYGLQASSRNLCRIDASGTATVVATLNDLNSSVAYWAGDVSQDGNYLYVIGTGGDPFISREIARINLNNYSVESYSIPNAESVGVIISDFSFDPSDGSLFGFDDIGNRLIKFDPNIAMIDETLFPVSDVADGIGATFIDPFGNLYGYGRRKNTSTPDTFFKIDKNSGAITTESLGPEATGKDGCACPYTVKLQKVVHPEVALPCAEVTYVFKIVNASSTGFTGQDFLDEMPEALTITEIVNNPFGGDIVSGVGSNILSIENMSIPIGLDSIVVRVEVAPDADGIYKNQAVLNNLPIELGGTTYSDDPKTAAIEDSTSLQIVPLIVTIENENAGICAGESLELTASSFGNVSFQWSDGSSESSILVSEEGWYWVEASSDCEFALDSIYVFDQSLNMELGPDLELELGDSVLLQPFFDGNPELLWFDPLENSLSCLNCPEPYASPIFDATYLLFGENEFGCSAADSVNIHVLKERKIYIPNTFSPNSDGVNDQFYIQGKGSGFIKTFKIFDRWGGVVFETKNEFINESSSGWDGSFKGKELNNGVYVYFAEIEFLDGVVKFYQGDVTLLR